MGRQVDDETIKQMRRMRANYYPVREIAAKYGISTSIVSKYVNMSAEEVQKIYDKSKIENFHDEIKAMYDAKQSYGQIEKKIGFSSTAIRNYIKKQGWLRDYINPKKSGIRLNALGFQGNICWKCARSCGFCSWSDKSFTPIPGWDAEKVSRKGIYGEDDYTYAIYDCPEFVLEKRGENGYGRH